MQLTPELVAAYTKILKDPQKHNLPLRPLNECFEEADIAIPKHLVYLEYFAKENSAIDKLLFYIIMDAEYPNTLAKAPNGDLGYRLKFKEKQQPKTSFIGTWRNAAEYPIPVKREYETKFGKDRGNPFILVCMPINMGSDLEWCISWGTFHNKGKRLSKEQWAGIEWLDETEYKDASSLKKLLHSNFDKGFGVR